MGQERVLWGPDAAGDLKEGQKKNLPAKGAAHGQTLRDEGVRLLVGTAGNQSKGEQQKVRCRARLRPDPVGGEGQGEVGLLLHGRRAVS